MSSSEIPSYPSLAAQELRHAYLHVPYCLHKCQYCAFASAVPQKGESYKPYLDALQRQIRTQSGLADPVKQPLRTLYIGGGTPTCLPTEVLIEIVELIRGLYGFTEDAEITLEMNPGNRETQDLSALRAAGVNRLSIGVQSMDNELLRRLGRVHTVDDVYMTLEDARSGGFTNINTDLMLGLPGQTIPAIEESVRALVQAGVTHLSFYSLILEEDTPLAHKVEQGLVLLPDDDLERDGYHAAFDLLESLGLPPYEISCAARPGYESRHNMAYWAGRAYYGWGPSAASYVQGVRRNTTRSTEAYIEAWEEGTECWAGSVESIAIDAEEAMREYLIFGLRRRVGVSDREAIELLGRPIPVELKAILEQHVETGLLLRAGEESWIYTRLGLDMADTVARDLI